VANWFHDTIVETNRLPLFCIFAGMLVGFLFIRFSVRMIRAQVKWWPGNVKPGGMHIHHVVFGVIFMMLAGVGGFALPDRALVGLCITGSLFGLGAALVLDEFALILHLQDVYWAEEGRTSVDAIFVAVAATGLLLLGFRPLDLASDDFRNTSSIIGTSIVILLYLALIAITLLKGKVWTGLLGILFPLFLIFGAIRVGRPHSPWARWRYRPGKRRGEAKMARAQKRERRYRAPMIRAKDWLQNAVAGRPSEPNPPPPELATSSSMADRFDPLDDGGLYDSPAIMAHYRDREPANSGAAKSATPKPDSGQPGSGQPGSGQPDSGQPGTTKTAAGTPGSDKSASAKPGSAEPASPRWRGE